MTGQTHTEPEIITDHTDIICSTSIERIVTGRNAALAQIEALIRQLNDISALTRSIGDKTALDWAMKQDFRCGCWLMEKTETAMKDITRNLDRSIWRDLMKKSGMLRRVTSGTTAWKKRMFRRSAKRTSSVPLSNCIRVRERCLNAG